MIAEAERQTPETVRREYAETYLELQPPGTRRWVSSTTSVFRRHTPRSRRPGRPRSRSSFCSAPTREGASSGSGRTRRPSISGSWRSCATPACESVVPPLRPRLPARLARGDRRLCRAGAPATPRPRRRAAARDRRVHRGHGIRPIELLGVQAPGPTNHRRPCDPRRRQRARPPGARASSVRRPRGTSRRVRPGRRLRDGNRHLHRLGLERQDRPARAERAIETTAGRRSAARSSLPGRFRFGADEGAAASASSRGRTPPSTWSTHR